MASRSLEEIEYQQLHYHDDKAPGLIAGSILLITLATVMVVLRLVARRRTAQSWQADDYSIVAALIFAFGMFVSIIMALHYGMGKHAVRVGIPNVKLFVKSLYALEAIYPACTATTKLSILLLYRRIFTANDVRFRIGLYTIGSLHLCWGISGFFTTVFQCTPVHYLWDQGSGSCVQLEPSLVGLAVINTVLNGAVLVLPLPMVWQLNMPTRQKIAVIGIFILASLDILSSIIRTYMMSMVTSSLQDITWIDADGVMLAFVEPCVGIICACLPAMRSLFRSLSCFKRSTYSRHFKASHTSSSSSGGVGQGGNNRPSRTKIPLHQHRVEEFPFGQKPQNGWVQLDPLGDQTVVSEIYRNSEPSEQAADGDDQLPKQGIKVKSDLEWSVSHTT